MKDMLCSRRIALSAVFVVLGALSGVAEMMTPWGESVTGDTGERPEHHKCD